MHTDNYAKRLAWMQSMGSGYAFHIGLREPELVLTESWAWSSDGDSWNRWGEERTEGEAFHVVILTHHPEDMLEAIQVFRQHLVPMGPEPGTDQEGSLVCCTDPLAWSERDYPRWQLRMEQSNG